MSTSKAQTHQTGEVPYKMSKAQTHQTGEVPYKMSKAQTHQTNGQQLSYIPDLVKIFSYVKKCWIKPGFKARLASHLYDSRIEFHYIDNDV